MNELSDALTMQYVNRIQEATIKLDGITLIAGKNATGKSTIVKMLDCFLDLFMGLNRKIRFERRRSLHGLIDTWLDITIPTFDSSKRFEVLSLILDQIDKNCLKSIDESFLITVAKNYTPKDNLAGHSIPEQDASRKNIIDRINAALSRSDEDYRNSLMDDRLKQTFSGSLNSFLEKRISPTVSLSLNGQEVSWTFDEQNYPIVTGNSLQTKLSCIALLSPRKVISDNRKIVFLGRSFHSSTSATTNYLDSFHEKESLTYEAKEDRKNDISTFESIIDPIIHGQIVRNPASHEMQFHDEVFEKDIPLSNVADGILPFAIIESAIQMGKLKRNGFLLVDEPEMNLHPEWQVKFARLLVELNTQMGIHVVASSHSPFFIRALELVLNEHENKSAFYLMEASDNSLYSAKDVTDNLKAIYDELYLPLQGL